MEWVAGMVEGGVVSLGKALSKLGGWMEGFESSSLRIPGQECAAPLARIPQWYLGLPEQVRWATIVLAVFLAFLGFIFTMPRIMDRVLGPGAMLDTVLTPQIERGPSSDPQFAEADVVGQLAPEGIEGCWECIRPVDGEFLGRVKGDDWEGVKVKVAKARKAQRKWSETGFEERRRVMETLKGYILREYEDICKVSCLDTGKVMVDAYLGEILTTLEKLRWITEEGERWIRPERRSVGPLAFNKEAWVEFYPLGVIGAIVPWNYPFHNLMNPVISSLFAGNAIVVKPSEYTLYSSVYYARIVRRALALCGHSPELVQLVVGGATVGAALVDSDIDKLFFTGSTEVGKKVSIAAAKRLLPVVLELGGKDPFIVCSDADVSHAADTCLRGVFQNSGQNCIGVERVYVHSAVKEEFLSKVLPAVTSLRLGVDLGALTMGPEAVKKIQALVDDAVGKGAEVLVGGKAVYPTGNEKGAYFAPTVIHKVLPSMKIVNEEVFGPVMCIFDFEDEGKVIKEINNCRYGLSSSIFSSSKRRVKRFMSALRCGMGNVNDFGVNYLCQSLPFGGTKDSGSGRFAGVEGLRGCCLMKSSTRNRPWFPNVPQPPHFKYPVSRNAFHFAAEVGDITFNTGLLNRIDNVRNLIGMFIFRGWWPRGGTGSGW